MRLNDIVPRSHPAVAAHPENFRSTSVGDGDWGDDEELVAELVERSQKIADLHEFEERRRRITEIRRPPPPPSPAPRLRKASKFPWGVVLRTDASPRYTINLSGSVARSILAEVALVAPERLETGGMLFAWESVRTLDAHVVWASGAGNGSRHGSRSLLFATERDTRAAFPDWLHGENLKRVGDWHYHPVAGASWPCRADMNVWASYLWKDDRVFAYPTIIVCPGGAGGPRFHGWLTRRDGERGRYVCEPALLSDLMGYCS